jgi:divalent metal cation (Fe/Co/Zn/Cd) transporter
MRDKRLVISKGIALLIGGVGLFLIWTTWFHIITRYHFESLWDVLFLFIFPIPCTLVALYLLSAAKCLWLTISSKGIHKLSISLSAIFAVLIFSVVGKLESTIYESDKLFWRLINVPFALIMAGIFYLSVKRCLFKWFSVSEEFDSKAHERATKCYFGFLAFSIWNAVSQTSEFLPKDPQFEHVPQNHWHVILIMFGSLLLAFWIYRLGLKVFLKKPLSVDAENNEILKGSENSLVEGG